MLRPEGCWLVFFDLDGTIMCGVDDVRPAVLDAFRRLRERGNRVVLATGRAPVSIPAQYLDAADCVISLTGALCSAGDKVLFRVGLPRESIFALAHACEELELPLFLESAEHFCAFGRCPWFTGVDQEFYHTATIYLEDTKALGAALSDGLSFQKGCLGAGVYRRLEASLGGPPSGIQVLWAGDSVDLVPEGVNKGVAAKRLQEQLGQPVCRTICFGDSDNDLELFHACAMRVSVGERSPALLRESSFVTGPVQEDGAVRVLEALGFFNGTT